MVWYFIGVHIINRTLHGLLEIRNFSSHVEKIFQSFAALTREIFCNTQREICISAQPCNILYLLLTWINKLLRHQSMGDGATASELLFSSLSGHESKPFQVIFTSLQVNYYCRSLQLNCSSFFVLVVQLMDPCSKDTQLWHTQRKFSIVTTQNYYFFKKFIRLVRHRNMASDLLKVLSNIQSTWLSRKLRSSIMQSKDGDSVAVFREKY